MKLCLVFVQAYKIGKDSTDLVHEPFGSKSAVEFVDNRSSRILSRRRRDLRGQPLITSLVFMTDGSENHTDLDDYQYVIIHFILADFSNCLFPFLVTIGSTPCQNYHI